MAYAPLPRRLTRRSNLHVTYPSVDIVRSPPRRQLCFWEWRYSNTQHTNLHAG